MFFALGDRPLATLDRVSAGCTSLRASRKISLRPAACLSAESDRSCSGEASRDKADEFSNLSTLLTVASPPALVDRSITSSLATLPAAAFRVMLRGLVVQSYAGAFANQLSCECCGVRSAGPPGQEFVEAELTGWVSMAPHAGTTCPPLFVTGAADVMEPWRPGDSNRRTKGGDTCRWLALPGMPSGDTARRQISPGIVPAPGCHWLASKAATSTLNPLPDDIAATASRSSRDCLTCFALFASLTLASSIACGGGLHLAGIDAREVRLAEGTAATTVGACGQLPLLDPPTCATLRAKSA